jgi:hypothetical protein
VDGRFERPPSQEPSQPGSKTRPCGPTSPLLWLSVASACYQILLKDRIHVSLLTFAVRVLRQERVSPPDGAMSAGLIAWATKHPRHMLPLRTFASVAPSATMLLFPPAGISAPTSQVPLAATCEQVLADLRANLAPTATGSALPQGTLDGKLGGTVAAFEHEFGSPVETTGLTLFREYAVEGTSSVLVDETEGIIDSISAYSPRSDGTDWTSDGINGENWSRADACRLALSFLPADVDLLPRVQFVSAVEHYPGMSRAFEAAVPMSVYAYNDNNPTLEQFSIVLSYDPSNERVNVVSVQRKDETDD